MARNTQRRIAAASFCTGLAVLASSVAAEQPAGADERVATTDVLLPEECFGGQLRRGSSPQSNTVVYDNTRAGFFTNTANPRQLIDDVELKPGAAANATFPFLINGINLGFTAQTVANFDIEVTFYDGINENSGAGNAINSQPALGTAVIQIRNLPNTGGFQTGMVSLAALPGGGVSVPDGGLFVRVRFLQAGTNILATTVTNTYASSWNTGSTNWTSSMGTGRSYSGAFRDVNGDGVLDSTEFRNFTFPAAADQYLALQADVTAGCAADFNGDQVVDFFDYLDFVDAFSVGCP